MSASIRLAAKSSRLHEKAELAQDIAVLIAVILVVWEILYYLVGATGISPPVITVINAYNLLASAEFWPNVSSTFSALGIAMAFEIVLGLTFGMLLGLNRRLGDIMEPVLTSTYALPKIIFYPIILMFFGVDMASEVVFGFIHGFFPITLFTLTAVRNIKPVYLKTGRAMGLSAVQTTITIALRATFPIVFTGLRLGFSTTLIGVLFSEMFSSKNGLGYLLVNAIALDQVSRVMALTLLLAGFAVIVNLGLLAVDHKLHKRI